MIPEGMPGMPEPLPHSLANTTVLQKQLYDNNCAKNAVSPNVTKQRLPITSQNAALSGGRRIPSCIPI